MSNEDLTELITYSTTLIKACKPNNMISYGTGFFMEFPWDNGKGIPVLVTNKHVISGSTSTHFEICRSDKEGKPIDTEVEKYTFDSNLWIMHPSDDVDLCCFPISPVISQKTSNCYPPFFRTFTKDLIPSEEQVSDFSAIEDVFMVGYPSVISDDYNHKPLFRKGITATQLKHDYRGKKDFLIDCPCFKGSSGSPVFMLDKDGIYRDKKTSAVRLDRRFHLLGIQYSIYTVGVIEKEIEESCVENKKTICTVPNNLGLIIKSELLLDFEPILREMAGAE